jgi:hypothetical protein
LRSAAWCFANIVAHGNSGLEARHGRPAPRRQFTHDTVTSPATRVTAGLVVAFLPASQRLHRCPIRRPDCRCRRVVFDDPAADLRRQVTVVAPLGFSHRSDILWPTSHFRHHQSHKPIAQASLVRQTRRAPPPGRRFLAPTLASISAASGSARSSLEPRALNEVLRVLKIGHPDRRFLVEVDLGGVDRAVAYMSSKLCIFDYAARIWLGRGQAKRGHRLWLLPFHQRGSRPGRSGV